MNLLIEQIVSKKLGVVVVAIVVISQLETVPRDPTKWLIAAVAAVHVICQTWLDARRPVAKTTEGTEQ